MSEEKSFDVKTATEEELRNRVTELEAENELLLKDVVGLEDEIVNRSLEDFAEVVSEATREFWKGQLIENREAATEALKDLLAMRGAAGGRQPLHNRGAARPAVRTATGEADAAGARVALAGKIRNRAHEISRAEHVPYSVAFRRAESELGTGGK
ncbi:MAG: hypothetical protein PHR35_20505 [Kiritimatiellae bacterium]|nr:hypothetical protein [Kiritimatiellia bacterium]